MTATLTREARYARIAELWPELRARAEPWALLVAAAGRGKSYGLWQGVVGAILCHATETPTSVFCENALLSAVERLLGLEEWC